MPEIAPKALADTIASRSLDAFTRQYDDSLLMVVRIPEGEGGQALLSTLQATLDDARTASVKPAAAMEFHTEIIAPEDLREQTATVPPMSTRSGASLARWLGGGQHYVVRLRKREGADSTYTQRVSLGRATNKDIVFRHGSVSKFHAWFEMDEDGIFYVADSGSKNGTRLDGGELFPRERVEIRPGSMLTFGSIECGLCTPAELWRALKR